MKLITILPEGIKGQAIKAWLIPNGERNMAIDENKVYFIDPFGGVVASMTIEEMFNRLFTSKDQR